MRHHSTTLPILTLLLFLLCVLAGLATGCDGQQEAEGSEEGRETAAATNEESQGDEPLATPAPAPAAPSVAMPPLHELSPEERLVVLASHPVPWDRLGELGVSLYDARLSLHRLEGGGPVIDLGHASAAKHVQGRWRAPWLAAQWATETEAAQVPALAGRQLVWNEGSGASVRFPLPDDIDQVEDYVLLLRLRPKVNTRVEVRLNDEGTIGVVELKPNQWQTARLTIPAKKLRFGGENTVSLLFTNSYFEDGLGQTRVAARFDWMRLVPSSQVENYAERAPRSDLAEPEARVLATKWRSLALAAPARLDAYQVIPEHARLRLFVAPASRTQTPTPVQISVKADGQEARVLWSQVLEPGAPWQPLEFDLSELGGMAARISFEAQSGPQGSTGDAAAVWLGEPALVIVRPAAELGRAPKLARTDGSDGEGPAVETPVPERVVVIAIDALRADRIAPQPGELHPATPNLSRLANEGVRLEAVAQGAGAIVPTVSLMTSSYAENHGVFDTVTHVRESFVTLGELFGNAGWETALLSTDPFVAGNRGYAQGFDRYRNLVEEQGPARTSRLIEEAVRLVKKESARSRMIYVQIGGLRLPHQPGSEALSRFFQGAYNGPVSVQTMMNPQTIPLPLSDSDRRYLNAVYDAELFEIDALISDLLTALTETGSLERTLVVIVGVHGEPLGEDDALGYNNRPTHAELRVPLVFYWPAGLPAGRRPRQLAEQVDLVPTLAELSGLAVPETAQGTSLRRVLYGERDNSASAAFSVRQDTHRSATQGRYHYVLRTGDNDLFYDLTELAAGGVLADRTAELPIARRALRDALGMHLGWAGTLWNKRSHGTAVAPKATFVEQVLERGW